jgi:hypothetical protein
MIESRAPTQGGVSGIREVVRFVNRQKLIIFVPAVLIAGMARTIAAVTVPRYTAAAAALRRLAATLLPDAGSDVGRVCVLESVHYMRNQLLRDADWAGMARKRPVHHCPAKSSPGQRPVSPCRPRRG